jgi:uncharacterized protein (DUF1778 family)
MRSDERVALRLSDEDNRALKLVAAHLQRRRGSPFVSPAEAVRAALRLAAETLIREGMAAQRASQ